MNALFWKALFGLLAYDLLLAGSNFAKLHATVHDWKTGRNRPPAIFVERVCEAMNTACAWYPKRALCLQRAAVTTYLLRSYGVPALMVLGAQKTPFKAHAWVEVDGLAINENTDVRATYGVWERC